VHLGSFAVGGAGLIFTEATAVEDLGRITPYDAGLWMDEHIPGFERIVKFIHEQHALAGIQLAHAGRKGSTDAPWQGGGTIPEKDRGWEPIAPSAIPLKADFPMPKEMSKEDIQRVITKFKEATIRARKAGFDVVEIHGAHGYLINQFLSSLSNKRTDEYGGDFEGRIKFCVDVIKAVRQEWPKEKPLFLRLSCTEWVEGGWNIEDTLKLVNVVKDLGIDVIDCSTGGNSPNQQIHPHPGYQVPFSAAIKAKFGDQLRTMAVGILVDPKQCQEVLQKGEADLVALAREFLREPHWPKKAADALGVKVHWPVQYERARRPPKQ